MATTYLSSLQAAATITAGDASPRPRSRVVTCHATDSSGRRSACLGLGLAAAGMLRTAPARAADTDEDPEPANNGWWLTEFPLPVPKIRNSKPPQLSPYWQLMVTTHSYSIAEL
jgi:photosystem II oxygen-evolving enhancer protein 3